MVYNFHIALCSETLVISICNDKSFFI